MRRFLPFAIVCLTLTSAHIACAQQSDAAKQPGASHVSWSYDPLHGTLEPKLPGPMIMTGDELLKPDTSAAGKTYSGTIDIDLTINLVSPVVSGSELLCSGAGGIEYEVIDQPLSKTPVVNFYILSATQEVDATVSGDTATCRFSIPYSWTIPTANTSTVVIIYGITGSAGVSELVTDSKLRDVNFYRVARSNSVVLNGPTTLPANGTTIPLSATTVL
jgi:hypothetical protein